MSEIVTKDRRLLDLIELARTVAQSKATVLIQGESGTGKELMAQLIHENSNRMNGAFIAINCAAIPENLLESELFGHERGSFTGAVATQIGKFEAANCGTILLDEISEMDVRLQAKLLRVIQEGQVDRIGGKKSIPVDVRVIATTNRNLSESVRNGTFREDLYYRLNVVNLTMPPLRDRVGDVNLLARHFTEVFGEGNPRGISKIDESALRMLEAYHWPGNVRELENVIERAVIVSKGPVLSDRDIRIERDRVVSSRPVVWTTPETDISADSQNWTPGQTLDDIERSVIINALTYHSGNRTHTARALGISIRTLRNKLADYRKIGIQV